jgi:hypothetical protein
MPIIGLDRRGILQRRSMKPSEVPVGGVFIQLLQEPGFLTGREPVSPEQVEYVFYSSDEARQRAGDLRGLLVELNGLDFVRMIAKVAHCVTVAELGVDGFEPLLKEVILTCDPGWSRYVGAGIPFPQSKPTAHWMRFEVREIRGARYSVVFMQLCAFVNAPIYGCITGRVIGQPSPGGFAQAGLP